MLSKRKMRHSAIAGLILVVLLAMLSSYGTSNVVSGHSKELSLEVSTFTPNAEEPLVRLYHVFAVYAVDQEPVTGAEVQLTSERQGGGPPLEPIILQPINEPGTYAAQVTYPLYGSWDVTLKVVALGEGKVTFVDQLVPAWRTPQGCQIDK